MLIRKVFERVGALARVGVYGTCVLLGLGAVAARSAYGNAGEATMIMGREFAALGGLVGNGNRVRLNGEEIYVGSTIVDLPTDEVLDRFEALCRKNSQGLEAAVKDPALGLTAEDKASFEAMGLAGLGILRQQSHGEGTVACVTHQGGGGLAELGERLATFSKSRDLKDLGKLRYVYTRPTSNKARSQVITVWSEGTLRLDRIFVEGAEAPGSDPVGVPRLPGSVRLLSAEIDGAPYGVRIYDVEKSPTEVLSFYDEKLPAEGWKSAAEVPKAAPDARSFSRNGAELMVYAEANGTKTTVSMVELPAQSN